MIHRIYAWFSRQFLSPHLVSTALDGDIGFGVSTTPVSPAAQITTGVIAAQQITAGTVSESTTTGAIVTQGGLGHAIPGAMLAMGSGFSGSGFSLVGSGFSLGANQSIPMFPATPHDTVVQATAREVEPREPAPTEYRRVFDLV